MTTTIAPAARQTAPASAGVGRIGFGISGGRTRIQELRANSPLKLLSPRPCGRAAWVVCSTYGGGLLAGDRIDLTLDVAADATALFGTQASTKIYRSPAALPATQQLAATIAPGALLALLPDPLTCFAGAVYEQRQTFNLASGASLLLLDCLTSGRLARGERWAFNRCLLSNDIFESGQRILADRVSLDGMDGPLAGSMRTGGFDCLATVVMLGPQLHAHAAALGEWVARQPVSRPGELLFAASALRNGLILRAAGSGAEAVGRWLRQRLDFIGALLGEDPWQRKH